MDQTLKQQELDTKRQMQEKERQVKLKLEEKEREERSAFEKEKFGKELEAKMAFEQAKLDKHVSSSSSEIFDATKNIRLVQKFQETEVDKYFCTLRKLTLTCLQTLMEN